MGFSISFSEYSKRKIKDIHKAFFYLQKTLAANTTSHLAYAVPVLSLRLLV